MAENASRAVVFYFDFGSPNAYLAHKVIPAIEQRTGAKFRYVPALLGGIFKATGNRSPVEAFAGIRENDSVVTHNIAAADGMNTDFRIGPFADDAIATMARGFVQL